jgi:hypothetical protein
MYSSNHATAGFQPNSGSEWMYSKHLPSFCRVLSRRELTSAASCAASQIVVNSHIPASPLARKGPFRIIAIRRLFRLEVTWYKEDRPAYSPLDAYTYRDGVHLNLPEEVINAALECGAIPATAIATRCSLKRHENESYCVS